jgi:restriction system protein
MARRKQGLFESVASVPWPVGVVLGILGFIAVRYGIGWVLSSSSNPFLAPIGHAASHSSMFTMLAWASLGICWASALVSFIGRHKRKQLLATQTGLESLQTMSWREFEMLVGEAFRRQGYRIEETGLGGADGGIDLRLSKNSRTTLVQCKQWRSQRVDVKVVREMYGLLAHHGADAIKIVAVGDFTLDAQRFVQGKPIELVHGEALLAMIREAQASDSGQRSVPHAMPSAASTTPECPKCGAPMVKRANRRSHESFWGCAKYPSCRGTRTA